MELLKISQTFLRKGICFYLMLHLGMFQTGLCSIKICGIRLNIFKWSIKPKLYHIPGWDTDDSYIGHQQSPC